MTYVNLGISGLTTITYKVVDVGFPRVGAPNQEEADLFLGKSYVQKYMKMKEIGPGSFCSSWTKSKTKDPSRTDQIINGELRGH